MSIQVYDTANQAFQGGVPANAEAIVCYADRLYRNVGAAQTRFPALFKQRRVLCATAGSAYGGLINTLDYEQGNGDPSPDDWVANAMNAGIWRPCVYADVSDTKNVVIPRLTARFGPIKPAGERPYRLFVAAPDGVNTTESLVAELSVEPDIKQYWFSSIQGHGGADFDISVARTDAFEAPAPPAPAPDVMNYVRYPDVKEPSCGGTNERALVKLYDEYRAQQTRFKHPHQAELATLRAAIQKHVDLIVQRVTADPHPKQALGVDWRAWRLERLLTRVNGGKVNP